MIWLVGHRGMLGTEVAALLDGGGLQSIKTDAELDITNPHAVDEFVREHRPDWIVNCAAYTAVDRAEDEEERAYAINAAGPENLGRADARLDKADDAPPAKVVHISTDYVFDGTATEPIPESAAPAPVSAYGRTKAAGERLLAAACPSHFIVRTAWLYGVHGKSFVSTMLRLMRERDELSVVADQVGSPTYAVDLARAIVALVRSGSDEYGVYHYTNGGETNWHGFAVAIRNEALRRGILDRETEVHAITTSEYPTKAARPSYSVLAKERIARVAGVVVPPWEDGLSRYFDQYERERGET